MNFVYLIIYYIMDLPIKKKGAKEKTWLNIRVLLDLLNVSILRGETNTKKKKKIKSKLIRNNKKIFI